MQKSLKWFITVSLGVVVCANLGWTASSAPKPKKIVVFMDTILDEQQGQKQFTDEYKKFTGIELQIVKPVHNQYYDKMRLAFASGDVPDVVEIESTKYVQYASEGAFVDVGKYVKSSAPLQKVAKSFDQLRLKGKLYGVPLYGTTGPVTFVRKDWLKNLGLKPSTTWTEYYNLLKAFTKNDPDQNGKNDTYGFTGPGTTDGTAITLADNFYREFYQNASPDFTYRQGKWVDGFSQKEMKPALERLRQAYMEHLLDPEIFTNKTSTCREKFQSGKAGVFPYWAGMWQVRLEEDLQKNMGEKATIMPIAALKGSYYLGRVPLSHAITVKAKNPEGIFKYFIEFSHDGGKGQMLFVHGVENVHWKKDGTKLVALPQLDNPNILTQKSYYAPAEMLTPWANGQERIALDPRVTESRKVLCANIRMDKIQVFPDSRKKIEDALINAKNDALSKAITGAKTVDQALADYQKKYNELNVARVLKDINAQGGK